MDGCEDKFTGYERASGPSKRPNKDPREDESMETDSMFGRTGRE